MSNALAIASRDRALQLLNNLSHWENVVGIGSTSTIVSHYKRRGDYRVHSSCTTPGTNEVHSFSLTMAKGARERWEEDEMCGLLTLRALAKGVGDLESFDALENFKLFTKAEELEGL